MPPFRTRKPRRMDRYTRQPGPRQFRYHSLRRLAKSDLAEELRESQQGHLVTHAHGHTHVEHVRD